MSNNGGARTSGWTRREALGALGASVGLGFASEVLGAPRFPPGAVIRSLLSDLPPAKVGPGAVLFHEHLSYDNDFFAKLRSEGGAPRPGSPLADLPTPNMMEDLDWMTEEVKAAANDGVSCIVDGG